MRHQIKNFKVLKKYKPRLIDRIFLHLINGLPVYHYDVQFETTCKLKVKGFIKMDDIYMCMITKVVDECTYVAGTVIKTPDNFDYVTPRYFRLWKKHLE